jgi:hypothetical protein
MTLPRRMELHCQEEVVEPWLSTSGVPVDVREILVEWLKDVKEEINHLSTVNERPHQDKEPLA